MYKIMTYDPVLNADLEICEGKTLEEAIKTFEPVKKNHPFYFIRKVI